MPQYKTGTATATTGSAAVTGSGTAWTVITTPAGVVPAFVIPISAGGDGVLYDIASIAADGSLTLATPYQGATIAGAAYAIQYAYTDDGIPEMSPNDIETAGIFTRAMRKIQSLLNALRTGVADLSGVTDAATARTNLSVYSAAETDTAIAAAVDDLQTGYLTKSVAGSANVALTASEQSNAVIEFTGELTGNINVTVGDDKDGYRWTLINNTTGSFTLTFKATSGTGAVIDQGAEAVVYHDGTNIVELLTVTAAGKALMDDATADAQLETLGGTTVGKAVFTAADEAAAATAVAAIFPNYITGLIASNNATDANNDIDISAGACMDSTNAVMMEGSAMTKRLDAAWAAGTNQGGLDTGSKAINTEYYIHAIRKDSDASVDYLFSASRTAPTMPAGYTYFRHIGWCETDGSGNILGFVATEMAGGGLCFQWKVPVIDVALFDSLTTTARTDALSVPAGVKVRPLTLVNTYDGTNSHYDLVSDPDTQDTTPGSTNFSHVGGAGENAIAPVMCMTNTSRQIRARSSLATVDAYKAVTFGFEWSRR